MELQQSPPYLEYIKKLHWAIETIDGVHIFFRKFPLAGGFAKLQRMDHLPSLEKTKHFFKIRNIKRVVLEAGPSLNDENYKQWAKELSRYVTVIQSPYLPTKTIKVDLKPDIETIFKNFTEAKRRAVRKALKNNVVVFESDQINKMKQIKNKSAGMFGFITTSGLKEIWEAFSSENKATMVLAYVNKSKSSEIPSTVFSSTLKEMSNQETGELIGGVFLIFWENIAYYWIAGATKKGKKRFAPTLLAWEAIKVAKARGMEQFDFVGIWDERFPKENKDWLGFTKFKEGFGGKELYYPTHRGE